jgi:hypothetical protein
MCCRSGTLDLDIDRFSNDDNNPTDTRLTIAARLLRDLEPQQNEFVTDRVAIWANLCGYSNRLDTKSSSIADWDSVLAPWSCLSSMESFPCLIWT